MGKKTDIKLKFTPLSKTIERKLRSPRFREAYYEEMSRLQLAHEIKALRKEKKLTQEQVAEKTQMPQSVIARIESGTHSFSVATLHKIARVFDRQIGLVE
jgi:DNA-binding XRE family transcriptional regulator